MYRGHLCYFVHLHSMVDFDMISFIKSMQDLNWVFEVPFFWLTVEVFVMKRLKQLMNLPF